MKGRAGDLPVTVARGLTQTGKGDKSGKCLSIDNGGSTANGAHAIQWTCNGGPEQNWDEDGGYLVNGKSNKVLSIEDGGSTVAGKHAIQWSANGGSEQGWDFQAIYIDA